MKTVRWTLTLAVVAATLVAGSDPASAANSVSVNAAAAQAGNFGLQINLDGTNGAAYVKDDSPANESHFIARFWVHPGTSDIIDNKGVRIFAIDTSDAGVGQQILLFLRHDVPGIDQYQLTIWVKEPGQSVPTYRQSLFLNLEGDRKWNQIELEWTQDTNTDTSVGNGTLVVKRLTNNVATRTISNLNGHTYDVASVRLGVLATTGANHNVCAQDVCAIWADEYSSFR